MRLGDIERGDQNLQNLCDVIYGHPSEAFFINSIACEHVTSLNKGKQIF